MEKVLKEKQLTVITPNEIGMLSRVTSVLSDNGVNIENICAYESGDTAIFHFLTSDNEKTKRALQEKGYQVVETEVIVVHLWNRPGSLSAVAAKFRQHAIDVQYVYGTSSLEGERMTMVFSAKDNEKAEEILDSMVIVDGY